MAARHPVRPSTLFIHFTTLFLLCLCVPLALGVVLHNPTSASKYVEIVPNQAVTITWAPQSGDPSTFKIKIRNRKITEHQGQWVLFDTVTTSSGEATTYFPDLPPDENYYVEADVYTPSGALTILYSGVNDMFSLVDASAAHLKAVPQATTSTPAPPPPPATTNHPSTGSSPPSAPSPSGSPSQSPITQTLASTVTLSSGISIVSYTVTTETAVPSSPSSNSTTTGSNSLGTIHHSNVGPILGGVLGGLCLILAIIAFLLVRRRRKQTQEGAPSTITADSEVRPFGSTGYRVGNSQDASEKGQLQRIMAERDALQVQQDSIRAYSSDVGSSATGSRSDTETENVLRQQIQTMNERILQLEAQVGSDRGRSSMEPPPPNYSAATQKTRLFGPRSSRT